MKQINFTNENGNVSAKVRESIREQVLAKAVEALGAVFEDAGKNANGGVSAPIAIDAKTGETIYAHFALTVSTSDPSVKVERKKSAKKVDKPVVDVPTLFD